MSYLWQEAFFHNAHPPFTHTELSICNLEYMSWIYSKCINNFILHHIVRSWIQPYNTMSWPSEPPTQRERGSGESVSAVSKPAFIYCNVVNVLSHNIHLWRRHRIIDQQVKTLLSSPMMLQAKIPLIHVFVVFCVWNEIIIIIIIMTTRVSLLTLVFPMMLWKKKGHMKVK